MKSETSQTLKIALPLILGNITQMALGLIDTAMVGSIDYKQLAAAAFVTNFLAVPHILGIGITTALTPLIAIANGQNDTLKASRFLYNGVILCTIISVFIAIAIFYSTPIVYHLGQDPEVIDLAIPYLKIMGWSTIPMIFYLSLKQFCDALEFTKVAMTLSLISLPINVFLNWVMIFGKLGFPRWELYGAGVATLITRWIVAIILFIVILKSEKFQKFIQIRKEAWVIRKDTIKQLLQIGIPSSMQYTLEVGAFAMSGLMIGWFGATQQAAHQIALNIASFTFMVIMGISTAGSIRVSNAYGRNKLEQLRNIGFNTLKLGIGCGVFFALNFVIFHKQLPYIFNQQIDVVSLAGHLLIFAAIFQISDATQAIGVGLLRGIKDVKIPTLCIVFAYWVIGLPLGYFLGVYYEMKATGMWIGLAVGLTASSILLNLRFHKRSQDLIRGVHHEI